MGPKAAVDAVFYNAIRGIADPEKWQRFVAERGEETDRDVDSLRPASDLVSDAVVEPSLLRDELLTRLACAAYNVRDFPDRRHGVPPA